MTGLVGGRTPESETQILGRGACRPAGMAVALPRFAATVNGAQLQSEGDHSLFPLASVGWESTGLA